MLQGTFVSNVQALIEYYNNVLPVVFWANSFENDLSAGFNTCASLSSIKGAAAKPPPATPQPTDIISYEFVFMSQT